MKRALVFTLALACGSAAAFAANRRILYWDAKICGPKESGDFGCDGPAAAREWPQADVRGVVSADASENNICLVAANGVQCGGGNPIIHALVPPLDRPSRVAITKGVACAVANSELKCWSTVRAGPSLPTPKLTAVNDVEMSSNGSEAAACASDADGVLCWDWYSYPSPHIEESSVRRYRMPGVRQIALYRWGYDKSWLCAAATNSVRCWGPGADKSAIPFSFRNVRSIAVSSRGFFALDDEGLKIWLIARGEERAVSIPDGRKYDYDFIEALIRRNQTASLDCVDGGDGNVTCWNYRISSVFAPFRGPMAAWKSARAISARGTAVCADVEGSRPQCLSLAPNAPLRLGSTVPLTRFSERRRPDQLFDSLLLAARDSADSLPSTPPKSYESRDRAGFYSRLAWLALGLDSGVYWEKTSDREAILSLNKKELEEARGVLASALESAEAGDFSDASVRLSSRRTFPAEAEFAWRVYGSVVYAASRAMSTGAKDWIVSAMFDAMNAEKKVDRAVVGGAALECFRSQSTIKPKPEERGSRATLVSACAWLAGAAQ